jgi:hypothetical protein
MQQASFAVTIHFDVVALQPIRAFNLEPPNGETYQHHLDYLGMPHHTYGGSLDYSGVLGRVCEVHGAAILRHKLANPRGCFSPLIKDVNEGLNALVREKGTASHSARQQYASFICNWAEAVLNPDLLQILLGVKKHEPDLFSLGITAAIIGDLTVVKKHHSRQVNHQKDLKKISNIIGAAVANGHIHIVEFFLEEFEKNPVVGAADIISKSILSDILCRPVELAIMMNQFEIGDLLYGFALRHFDQPHFNLSTFCDLDIVELCVKHNNIYTLDRALDLREHGMSLCDEYYQGFVSHELLMSHKKQAVCFLLQTGWLKPEDPWTPYKSWGFFSAMGYGRFETARILLEMGADVDEAPYRPKVFQEATAL